MISGAMPRWQQYCHRSPVVVVIVLGTLIWWEIHSAPSHPPQGNLWAIAVIIVVGLILIGNGFRFWGRLIKEFHYFGRTLTFNTLASPETQVRDISEIEEVKEWAGEGPLGYRIGFRGGAKFYLPSGVSSAAALAERLRHDLGCSASAASATQGRRSPRLAILLSIAILAGLAASVATSSLLRRLPPEISRAEFFAEVNEHHVARVVIEDRALISGKSSTRGPFRVRTPVDVGMVNELRSRGVVVEFESGSNLIP